VALHTEYLPDAILKPTVLGTADKLLASVLSCLVLSYILDNQHSANLYRCSITPVVLSGHGARMYSRCLSVLSIYFARCRSAKYRDERACMSVCLFVNLSARISQKRQV